MIGIRCVSVYISGRSSISGDIDAKSFKLVKELTFFGFETLLTVRVFNDCQEKNYLRPRLVVGVEGQDQG
jgi:hypothetical protein